MSTESIRSASGLSFKAMVIALSLFGASPIYSQTTNPSKSVTNTRGVIGSISTEPSDSMVGELLKKIEYKSRLDLNVAASLFSQALYFKYLNSGSLPVDNSEAFRQFKYNLKLVFAVIDILKRRGTEKTDIDTRFENNFGISNVSKLNYEGFSQSVSQSTFNQTRIDSFMKEIVFLKKEKVTHLLNAGNYEVNMEKARNFLEKCFEGVIVTIPESNFLYKNFGIEVLCSKEAPRFFEDNFSFGSEINWGDHKPLDTKLLLSKREFESFPNH